MIHSPLQHEAFLCGLLGRFGQLVIAQAIPDRYAAVLAESPGALPTAALERHILGYDYHQVGAALMYDWKFPQLLTETIRSWGDPEALSTETDKAVQGLCRLVHMADLTSQVIWPTPKEHALQALHACGYRYCGVAAVEIDACFLGLEAKLAETASLFDIKVTGLGDFQTILTEARDQLVQLSQRVAAWIAGATRHTDIVARYGGEEFVVLVPHTTFDVLHLVAERLRRCVAEGHVASHTKKLRVTISVGGACVRQVQSLADGMALCTLADQCLYEAKAAGRNRTVCREMACL